MCRLQQLEQEFSEHGAASAATAAPVASGATTDADTQPAVSAAQQHDGSNALSTAGESSAMAAEDVQAAQTFDAAATGGMAAEQASLQQAAEATNPVASGKSAVLHVKEVDPAQTAVAADSGEAGATPVVTTAPPDATMQSSPDQLSQARLPSDTGAGDRTGSDEFKPQQQARGACASKEAFAAADGGGWGGFGGDGEQQGDAWDDANSDDAEVAWGRDAEVDVKQAEGMEHLLAGGITAAAAGVVSALGIGTGNADTATHSHTEPHISSDHSKPAPADGEHMSNVQRATASLTRATTAAQAGHEQLASDEAAGHGGSLMQSAVHAVEQAAAGAEAMAAQLASAVADGGNAGENDDALKSAAPANDAAAEPADTPELLLQHDVETQEGAAADGTTQQHLAPDTLPAIALESAVASAAESSQQAASAALDVLHAGSSAVASGASATMQAVNQVMPATDITQVSAKDAHKRSSSSEDATPPAAIGARGGSGAGTRTVSEWSLVSASEAAAGTSGTVLVSEDCLRPLL